MSLLRQITAQRTIAALLRHGRQHARIWLVCSAGLIAGCSDSPQRTDNAPETPPASQVMDLTILHINDHHSHLDSESALLRLKNAAGDDTDVTVGVGGFPRITAAIKELASASANVLTLHAGDAMTGTLYFDRAGDAGQADAALMNTVCFDAMTLGNHEFDKGDSVLHRFIEHLHAGACQTPLLSANVNFGPSSALNPRHAPDWVHPAITVERGDQRIGLIGLTTALKTQRSSRPDPGTTFSDEADAAQAQIDALRAQGVNKIVLLSHIGYHQDQEIIPELSGVDVVVGGDSHTLLGPDALADYQIGTPAGPYPTELRDQDGKRVCLVQAWQYARIVGELHVRFDENGDVISCSGTPHILIDNTLTVEGAAPSAADHTAMRAAIRASGVLRVQTPDPEAIAALRPFAENVESYQRSHVAVAPQELCSRRLPGGPGSVDYSRSSAACNAEGHVDLHGGDIQQLVAQAYLDVTNASYGGADISLQSAGGVRVPLTGAVTAAKVIEVVPFGNTLYRLTLTGAEVIHMLEEGLDEVNEATDTTGPYPYTGGLRYDVDARRPRGQRVSHPEIFDQATGTWQPLDRTRSYRLVTPAFTATGGDGYTTLANIPANRRESLDALDTHVLLSYIDLQPTDPDTGLPVLKRLPTGMYSTRHYIGP